MEPLKEMFNEAYYKKLAEALSKAYPTFESKAFVSRVTTGLAGLSLNQRLRNTSVVLKAFLPANYKKALAILRKTATLTPQGYTALVYPDFVGLYGLHDPEASLEALKYFTVFGSSEFAVREFLRKDIKGTLNVMRGWADDKNHHVRRLASEGSRPRLPWSFKLDAVITDPSLTRPILEALKQDPELYVRKSVANHLNDISKQHPDYMLSVVKGWDLNHAGTAWIVKHASRSLIKKGHRDSLSVFDFEKNPKLRVVPLKLNRTKLHLGETLAFEFELHSEKNKAQKLVVDYIIHYHKKLGGLLPKVFKLKELTLPAGKTLKLEKKQVFKDLTTRKHYPGRHRLEIQVNGTVVAGADFVLLPAV